MLPSAETAAMLFWALLASGQNSSITGTLAGQIVMEGFVHLKISPWLRRLVTRGLAIVQQPVLTTPAGQHIAATKNMFP